MTSILERWFPFTRPGGPIQPGMYASQPKPDAAIPYRLHLRVEPNGSGLLLVNAATVLHLNATATAHALELIRDATVADAARAVRSRYRVSRRRALADQAELRDQVMRLATQPDVDPVVFLGMDRQEPHSSRMSAPYRIDLALTYATDPDGALDPLAPKRVDHELSTEEWTAVLGSAWKAGIPHVTFTGGEPTRRPDLTALIGYAQELGQISGLLTEGRRLADAAYMESLEAAGLDHILLAGAPDEASKNACGAALASDVFTAVPNALRLAVQAPFLRELKQLGAGQVRSRSPIRRCRTSDCSRRPPGRRRPGHRSDLGLARALFLPPPDPARTRPTGGGRRPRLVVC
jgi:hypothetical protein